MNETIEKHAIRLIKDFCVENPQIRLTFREKHAVKYHLKSRLTRYNDKELVKIHFKDAGVKQIVSDVIYQNEQGTLSL